MAIYEKHGSFHRDYSTGEMKSNLVLHSYRVCHNINNNMLKKDGGARVIFFYFFFFFVQTLQST